MTPEEYINNVHKGMCDNGGCGGQMMLMGFVALLLFLLTGCKTVSNKESYTKYHRMDSLIERMDSLVSKSYVVQQDSSWRELVMRQFESIKEKSDTSHIQVVDTAGNVIKETIVINNTKEVTSESNRQEIIGMIHRLEKLDSTLSVQNKQISEMDSLLKEKTKETTIEKKQPWWQSITQHIKGIIIGILLSVIVFLVLRLKKLMP